MEKIYDISENLDKVFEGKRDLIDDHSNCLESEALKIKTQKNFKLMIQLFRLRKH